MSEMLKCLWRIKAGTTFRPRTIVDVGAHTGTHGLYGLFTDPPPKYLLVEPQRECHAVLSSQMKAHDHVLVAEALSSQIGEAVLRVDPSKKDSGYLAADHAGVVIGTVDRHVPTTTLDHLIGREVSPRLEADTCIVVKIDVQGHELDVLLGATETLKHNCVLIVEVGTRRADAIKIFSLLDRYGYILHDCIDVARFPGSKRITSQFDAVFLRPDLARQQDAWSRSTEPVVPGHSH